MWKSSCLLLAAFLASTQAGTVIWDGTFSYYNTAADFDKWSWSNQVGEYQWYIHGSGATSNYLALDASYKNPAETRDARGLRVTVDGTSKWNGAMERTELIPQTKANLGSGQLYYHFSVKRGATNPPTTTEHQVVFFESHFTELKVGIGSDPTALNWCVGGQSKWSTPFVADVWHNFVYDINFSAGTVGLWHSTGGSPLTRTVANMAAGTSTNSADWHVGVLRLGTSSATEQWYFSGVYIESGSLTTTIGSGSVGTTAGPTTAAPTTTVAPTTVPPTTSTTTASGPLQTHYGQCGGIGYSGPTVCQDPYTCKALNEFYSQCL